MPACQRSRGTSTASVSKRRTETISIEPQNIEFEPRSLALATLIGKPLHVLRTIQPRHHYRVRRIDDHQVFNAQQSDLAVSSRKNHVAFRVDNHRIAQR